MDPRQTKKSNEGPPLPYRKKMMQQMVMNRNSIATVISSNSNDGAASDTDSGYEYVSNPMKKRDRSAVGKLTDGQEQQNEYDGNAKICKSQPKESKNADQIKVLVDPADCEKNGEANFSLFDKPMNTSHASMKLKQSVTEILPIDEDQKETRRSTYKPFHGTDIISPRDKENSECAEGLKGDTQSCNQDLFKYKTSSKGLYLASDDNILYKNMWQQQPICCPCKEDRNDYGYQKLIRETMEPTSREQKYQKLNKLTMEPSFDITNSQCSKIHHHTIWLEEACDGNQAYKTTRRTRLLSKGYLVERVYIPSIVGL